MAKVMPSGKFAGVPLYEVPVTYIAKCIEDSYFTDKELLMELKKEIVNRLNLLDLVGIDYQPISAKQPLDLKSITSIYRKLSIEFHPDKGGNSEAQKALNKFIEEVKTLIP